MRDNRIAACILVAFLLIISVPLQAVQCQNYYQYKVHIRDDGSALWTITQFASVNTTSDTWEGFQERAFDVVDTAASTTNRAMSIDERSLEINTTISLESRITEYSFVWQNFSQISGGEITFGDVFAVRDIFSRLYGDAAIEFTYPESYNLIKVNPTPYQRHDSTQTFGWSRTQDLTSNIVSIMLSNNPTENTAQNQPQYVIITIIGVALAASLCGFYLYRRQSKRKTQPVIIPHVEKLLETDEDKVVKLLRSVGGTMRQSEVTEGLKFSKAKTSQLLSVLEKQGTLARYKKGRDKIVTLNERVKGEK